MKMRMTLENFEGWSTQYYTKFLQNQCLQVISPLLQRKNKNEFCDPKHNVPHTPPPEINFPMTYESITHLTLFKETITV